jgi:NAD(P)H-nitrite reductase large subunit
MSAARNPKAKIVCECLGVTEAAVVSAIRAEGLATIKQVTACTEAGGGCTVCHPAIREYLAREERARAARKEAAESYSLSSPSFSAR